MRGPGRASPAVWLAGFAPLAACLAMTLRGSVSFDPQRSWAPFHNVDVIWEYGLCGYVFVCVCMCVCGVHL